MIGFLEPAALLFALPLAWLLVRTRPAGVGPFLVRALCLLCFVLALASPYLSVGRPGRDLVLVVDRSRSMPSAGLELATELVRYAQDERDRGDRLAVVSFGARAAVELAPTADGLFGGFDAPVDPDGSDLAGAIELALGLVPEGRPGSILLVTDGAATTRVPEGLAQRALSRGVTIDARPVERERGSDLSVERIELPQSIGEGEPFQFSVWVRSSGAVRSEFRLVRQGRVLSSGERSFEPGLNRLVFRDVLERGGVAEYAVELGTAGDTSPENNRGVGAVLVSGAPRVLVVNEDGLPSTLAQALATRGVAVETRSPEDVVFTPVALTAYRAVVLENVDAGRVGRPGMEALVDFVTERGGGLLVTGGRASFGRGGYYRSPLEPLLPVSLEVRQEHRKQAVALSIVMDRSGSMSAQVDATRTKMDLANAGAAAAIETLAAVDSVSVVAVDSEAHVVQPQTDLTGVAALLGRVRRIESMGGGIYCFEGLSEAVRQLARDERVTKHVILFADAADAEQQEGCLDLLRRARAGGVTCSVIALGTRSDPDAAFLEQVAAVGEGSAHFTTSPADLPRLFAQDTLVVSRANFVEEPTGTRALPGLLGLGDLPADDFPPLPAYNLTYARPEATTAVVTTDEYAAPVLAFAYRGLGRVAAYTGQVGGTFGAPLVEWDRFAGFAAGLSRWLLGTEEPGGLFASVERDGARARFRLELDQDAPVPAQLGALEASALLPDGTTRTLEFERLDANTFEARTDLDRAGTAIATVRLPDGTAFRLPPVSLPYSPEFADPGGLEPRRLVRRLVAEGGGRVLASSAELFEGERGDLGARPVHRELVLVGLLLVLLEIALRRLHLWGALRLPNPVRALAARRRRGASTPATAPARTPAASAPAAGPGAADRDRHRAPAPPSTPAAAPRVEHPDEDRSLGGALKAARERARGRLERGDGE